MDHLQLLYKYMLHLQHLEDSTFIELINTPFSSVSFTDEELKLLREMELHLNAGLSVFRSEKQFPAEAGN